MFDRSWHWCALVLLCASLTVTAQGQQLIAGDAPADPGPLANLPADLHSKSIRPVIRKVADWQLARLGSSQTPRTWDWGMLDIGLMAASHTLGDGKLSGYVVTQGEQSNWHIDHTLAPANDYAFAQALIDAANGSPKLISAVRLRMDGDLSDPFDPDHALWTRADALFFEAPVAAQLSAITGDPTYDEFVNREWHRTEKLLYDREKHLFASAKPLPQGQEQFEARSNGMAMAGLIRVLAAQDADDPLKPIYVDRLREMATAVAAAQSQDGLWRPSLLTPAGSQPPAVAGSSLILYALAWGINHHHLDAHVYLPVVERGWAGLVAHVYQDGRVGSIEPPIDAQAPYGPSSNWNYGTGAFLLAAGEVDALSQHKHW